MIQLIVDPEFQKQIPSLTNEEYEMLQENILKAGEVFEPITIWNNIIIDGHNRWKIICEHWEILKDKFRTKEMTFPDKWAAFEWMYRNQLGRRNLTKEQQKYLIGKMYEAQKHSAGGQSGNDNAKKRTGQNVPFVSKTKDGHKTADAIGAEFNMTGKAVRRAEQYSKGIDALKDISCDAAEKVLKGKSNITTKEIIVIPKMEPTAVEELACSIVNDNPIPRKSQMKRERKPGGWTKAELEDRAELEAIVADMYDRSTVPEYTVDSLVYEIQLCAGEYVQQIQHTLKDRKEILTQENKPIIAEAINTYIIKAFEKVRDVLK